MRDELPSLHIAVLDDDQLAALLFDIAHAAQLLGITARAIGSMATPTRWSLDDAALALRERRVAGVQIRYRHAGEEWCDTLQPLERGVRLVRINHTHAVTSTTP